MSLPINGPDSGIARTFQRLELFGTLTARENVQMAAETRRRRPTGASSRTEADIILAHVGLSHVADEPTDLLPTGLARLVELGRALATGPSVLLVDEPSSGLNQEETVELGRVLVDLAHRGIAVLLVEHDMSLVMNICDYVSVLDYGAVIAHGDPASVQADPAVQAAYLGAAEEDRPPEPSSPGRSWAHRAMPARPSTVGDRQQDDRLPPTAPGRRRAHPCCRSPTSAPPTAVSRWSTRCRWRYPQGSVYALLGPERRRQVHVAQGGERPDAGHDGQRVLRR